MNEKPWPRALSLLLDMTKGCSADVEVRRRRVTLLVDELAPFVVQMAVIKVAGTNGKGSVCAMLQAVLNQDGKSVGVFTSPHLFAVNERIRTNTCMISDLVLEKLSAELLPSLERFVQRHGALYCPSFFEVMLLIAFQYFHAQKVDFVIVEAGIGGYSDAVSAIAGHMAVITSVGIDHVEELGDTLASIVRNKAGIASEGSTLFLGPGLSSELIDIVKDECEPKNILIKRTDGISLKVSGQDLTGTTIKYRGHTIKVALIGEHQLANFTCVAAIVGRLVELGLVSSLEVLSGVEATIWPGRLEYEPGQQRRAGFIFDVAHNRHAFDALQLTIENLVPKRDRIVLYGASQGKDFHACLPVLTALASEVYLVEGFHRAIDIDELRRAFSNSHPVAGFFNSVFEAIEYFNRPSFADKVVLVVGSVYLVGNAREYLKNLKS